MAPMTHRTNAAALITAVVPAVLAVAALAFYATEVVILTFHGVPAENRDIVAGAVGFIGGSLVGCAFGYYFGASLHAKAEPPPGPRAPEPPRYG